MPDPATPPTTGAGPVTPIPHGRGDAVEASPPGLLRTLAPTVLVFSIAVCIVTDLISDIRAAMPLGHMVGMITGTVLSSACLVLMWRLLRSSRTQARALEVALDASRADVVEWRSKAAGTLQGLGALIDRQFDVWGLSPAEREVGILLLKGLSLKAIAEARETTERTARQQALAVYHKAGLAGRAELSAFFLEDLLLPQSGEAGHAVEPPSRPAPGTERSAA